MGTRNGGGGGGGGRWASSAGRCSGFFGITAHRERNAFGGKCILRGLGNDSAQSWTRLGGWAGRRKCLRRWRRWWREVGGTARPVVTDVRVRDGVGGGGGVRGGSVGRSCEVFGDAAGRDGEARSDVYSTWPVPVMRGEWVLMWSGWPTDCRRFFGLVFDQSHCPSTRLWSYDDAQHSS